MTDVHLLAAHYLQVASMRHCEGPKGRKRGSSDKVMLSGYKIKVSHGRGQEAERKLNKPPETAVS